jgi:hypothetical protein
MGARPRVGGGVGVGGGVSAGGVGAGGGDGDAGEGGTVWDGDAGVVQDAAAAAVALMARNMAARGGSNAVGLPAKATSATGTRR